MVTFILPSTMPLLYLQIAKAAKPLYDADNKAKTKQIKDYSAQHLGINTSFSTCSRAKQLMKDDWMGMLLQGFQTLPSALQVKMITHSPSLLSSLPHHSSFTIYILVGCIWMIE